MKCQFERGFFGRTGAGSDCKEFKNVLPGFLHHTNSVFLLKLIRQPWKCDFYRINIQHWTITFNSNLYI